MVQDHKVLMVQDHKSRPKSKKAEMLGVCNENSSPLTSLYMYSTLSNFLQLFFQRILVIVLQE